MFRTMMKSKIHRATVTQAELHYEGSVTIDQSLMEAANIVSYEQVDIYNITNGHRFTTYAIPGRPDSGTICINGAAAHLARPGDLVLIVTYFQLDENEVKSHQPLVHLVDANNRIVAR